MFCFHKNILDGVGGQVCFAYKNLPDETERRSAWRADQTDSVTKGCVSFKVDVAEYKGPRAGQPGGAGGGRGGGPWRLNKTSLCHQSGKWKSTCWPPRETIYRPAWHTVAAESGRSDAALSRRFEQTGWKRWCHAWEIDPEPHWSLNDGSSTLLLESRDKKVSLLQVRDAQSGGWLSLNLA